MSWRTKTWQAEILNGNFIVKPFDVTVGQMKMTVGGSNNVNGNLEYVTALNVPTGKLGNQLNARSLPSPA